MSSLTTPITLIAGATATGKSAQALALAQACDGVIINADSQQLYGDLRVLTARPSAEDHACVPHRLYGVLSGEVSASVAWWLARACEAVDAALADGAFPILVGGTGLYLQAFMRGLAPVPPVPGSLRAEIEEDARLRGAAAIHGRLQEVDPQAAENIGPHNVQRLVRAYSVWCATGTPLSAWQAQPHVPPYPQERMRLQRVDLPRDEIYARCNVRVDAMMAAGALEEVRALESRYAAVPAHLTHVIGVTPLRAVCAGALPLAQAVEQIKQETRRYAKRQLTWFRHQWPSA